MTRRRQMKLLALAAFALASASVAASGVRVGSANVHAGKTDSEQPPRSRTELQISGSGPYRAVKNLIERLLQSDPSLALDRVSFTRTADVSGELDVQLNLHVVEPERR